MSLQPAAAARGRAVAVPCEAVGRFCGALGWYSASPAIDVVLSVEWAISARNNHVCRFSHNVLVEVKGGFS